MYKYLLAAIALLCIFSCAGTEEAFSQNNPNIQLQTIDVGAVNFEFNKGVFEYGRAFFPDKAAYEHGKFPPVYEDDDDIYILFRCGDQAMKNCAYSFKSKKIKMLKDCNLNLDSYQIATRNGRTHVESVQYRDYTICKEKAKNARERDICRDKYPHVHGISKKINIISLLNTWIKKEVFLG